MRSAERRQAAAVRLVALPADPTGQPIRVVRQTSLFGRLGRPSNHRTPLDGAFGRHPGRRAGEVASQRVIRASAFVRFRRAVSEHF